jgi:hypothetical protein
MARHASVDWSFGGLPDEAPALRFKRSSTPLVSRSPFVPPQAYSLMGRIEIVYGGANTVLPGTMDTPANRAGDPKADGSQWVQPSQVAALLVHLASDAGAQVTGAAIPIYGRQV